RNGPGFSADPSGHRKWTGVERRDGDDVRSDGANQERSTAQRGGVHGVAQSHVVWLRRTPPTLTLPREGGGDSWLPSRLTPRVIGAARGILRLRAQDDKAGAEDDIDPDSTSVASLKKEGCSEGLGLRLGGLHGGLDTGVGLGVGPGILAAIAVLD